MTASRSSILAAYSAESGVSGTAFPDTRLLYNVYDNSNSTGTGYPGFGGDGELRR